MPVLLVRGVQIYKEAACQCRRHKQHTFSPWVGKIPWSKKWQPTPVFLPVLFPGQQNLVSYSPWGHKESDTTEHAHSTTLANFSPFYGLNCVPPKFIN